jgi:GT2 family glycosyltransferase
MLITVIIPTCNRIDFLGVCLNALAVGTQPIDNNWEVIVTDDSKNNISRSFVQNQYPWVTWVEGPKQGPAANRNNGAKTARGQWLVFLDDDCIPQREWLAAYIAIMRSSDEQVLEGSTNADRPQYRFDEEAPINLDGNNLWSCNFAIKKELFDQLSGFDETFPYAAMEDVDFYTRVLNYTHIKFVPEALVIHPWRDVKLFMSFNKHLRSQKHFAKKYGVLGTSDFRWGRAKIFVGGVFIDFKNLLKFSMRGWPYYLERCLLNFCMIFI